MEAWKIGAPGFLKRQVLHPTSPHSLRLSLHLTFSVWNRQEANLCPFSPVRHCVGWSIFMHYASQLEPLLRAPTRFS